LKLGTSSIEVSALALGADLIGTKIDRDQSFLLFEAIALASGSARHVLTSVIKISVAPTGTPLSVTLWTPLRLVWAQLSRGIKRNAKTLNLLRSSADRQSPSVGEHSFWPPGRKPR